MNLDKVPEETDSDNDDAGSVASFRSMSYPITPLKEVLSMQYSDSEEQTSGKKAVDKNEESIQKKSGKKKSIPKVNSPLPPPLQERAPPLPAQTRPPQPPPPPGEPKTMSVPVPFQKPRFSSKDLKLSKKKLRRAEEILKMVDVERADMFDKYKKYNHMPLVDSREYLRTLRAEIVSISFDGIEQLTDAFLFSLHHCKLSLTSLRWISLAGCYNITDEGIYLITQAFPTIKDIYLQGCRNFTEKGLYYLLNSSKNMRNIDMSGTNVGIIPSHAAGNSYIPQTRWGDFIVFALLLWQIYPA